MDRIFSTHVIPNTVRTDNGPPFTSREIQEYMQEMEQNHKIITPLWPQANSEAENFMKPLMKAICSANVEGQQWKRKTSVSMFVEIQSKSSFNDRF